MTLVTSFAFMLQELAIVMTTPTFDNLATITTGWVFAPRRTVTNMLVAAGVAGERHHSAFHRFFAGARWSLFAPHGLDIEDDPCLPPSVKLLDGNLVIGDGFDLCINRMSGRIEGFALHSGGQMGWLKDREGGTATEKAFRIVAIKQFAEPAHHEVFEIDAFNLDGYRSARANGGRITHQVEHGPGGMGEQVGQVTSID